MERKEYLLVKGKEILAKGTTEEIAKIMGTKERTIYIYTTPGYKASLERRTLPKPARELIPLFKEEIKVKKEVKPKVIKVRTYEDKHFYPNTGKPYSESDRTYIIDWYDKVGGEQISLAIGRKIETLETKVRDLRRQGLMPRVGMGKGKKVRY